MELAKAAKKPIVIHCRDAWPDCMKIWKKSGRRRDLAEFSTVFQARWKMQNAAWILAPNFLCGEFNLPKAQNLRDTAKALPLENI